MNEPHRPLLSDKGAPSFASFYTAATAFFGLEPGQPSGSLPSFAVFRRVDTAAMLRTKDAVAAVNFPLPEGLPPGAWVVVRGGSEWLDRRFLAWPQARGQEAGVTVELPAMTKIDVFLAARESDTVEVTQESPAAEATRAKVMTTVCAFANGAGGSLLFGITDDCEVVGLPAAKVSRYQDTLSELVDAWVEPTPPYSFEVLPVEGTELVVIEMIVNSGRALFGSSKPNEPRRVYIRHHSRSVPARVREIEGIVQSRSATGISRFSPV
jgi:hypothetical protein